MTLGEEERERYIIRQLYGESEHLHGVAYYSDMH